MSGQSAKKKRIGSRRRVANQNKTSEPDEFHITDSTSEAQCCIKEENAGSLNVLADADNSQSETQNPPSSEITENRRKLGSSRRHKGGQHVRDSAAESYHRPREDVEEEARGYENPRATQMSLEIQPQRQEQVSQGSQHIISATHDSSLYSALTPDYSPEVQSYTTDCPEPDRESLIPKSENLQAEQDENGTDYKVAPDFSEFVETMLIVTDKYDTLQSEENAHLVGASELTSFSVLSCPTVDQQLIDQSNSTEMPEELSNIDSVTEKESKERDRSTELSGQDGNLPGNYLSESHVKSAVTQFSSAPEITTDESSPRENIELENSIEQATFSSPNMELPKDKEQNEHFNFQVKGAQHSEDAINQVDEQEVKPTQIHDIDHSSESVTRDATENSDIISGNLTDQSEVSDTYQSELIVESADDSAAKQEDSNPDDRQDVHAVKDNSMEALDHTNEDYYVYDTETPQISGIERADTAPGQVYQTDDQVEDEIKPSAEQTVHREKEELFSEMQESDSSSQTLQSEDRLDSQSQLNDTGFSPTRNRRKLGSSRRIKGRHHAKDSVVESHHRLTEEVAGNTGDNEPLETTNISLTIETTVQEKSMETMVEGMDTFVTTQTEEISDPVEENAYVDTLGGISELTTSTVDQQLIDQSNSTEMPEEELPDSVTEKEEEDGDKDADLLRQDGNLQDNYLVSESHFKSEDIESCITPEISKDKHNPSERTEPECSVEQATVSSTKEELPTSEEQNEIFSEVKGAQHSEDPENNLHEQEVKPTQIHDIDHSSESVTRDATENSDIISGNLTDQSEVSDTYQSELIVESADDSAAKQEDSNPDDRQDVHAVKDNSMEALDHTNEDYYVYDTETPQISGIERADTAPGQVYQTDDQVEDEIKPSVEQTVHPEREELFSEMQESDSSSQTLQSEDRLDSQSQLNDTGFSPTRNRRKLGSSRRIKGRHHAKDSVVESHHRLTEEVAGNTGDNEPLETTNISLTIETTVQEKSMETMVEGLDTFVTTQTEEISDPVEENAYVDTLGGISELTTSTVDQQLIDQSNSTEMPEEELPDSVTEKEEEDGDKDADLLRQYGNLQDNYLVSESHFKSEDIESCITPEISKDKHNPSERTEPECSVEQATVSSTKEELPTREEQNEIFSEVKGAQHSEDPENNLHEQEVKPTQIHDIDHSSESVIRDATENSDIISGNLTDQSEVSDTYQSELIVESADDSAVKQEDSNPDDRQDVHAVKDNSMEALDHTNEDYYVYDTETPQISGIERADTAPGQVYQTDDQVEDEIKPSAEQTVHPEREELFSEMQESDSSSQTLQSEDRLDSQSQLNDTGFSPTRNRRKLGSSRRIKGRHHAKDSVVESHHRLTEEVAGNTRDNEPLETTNISLTIETTVQEKSMETMVEGMDTFVTTQTEEISNPVEENAYVDTLGGISELPTSTVDQQLIDQSNSTEMPEEELPDSVTEKEEEDGDKDADLLRQYGNLQDNYLVSESHFKSEDIESCITPEISKDKHNPSERTEPECSVEQATVSSTKEELPTREEQNEIFSEVKGAQHSEDPENNLHEQEVKPTQIHDIDHSSESVIRDATENSDIISGNLTDQSEVSDTYQSELIVESADDSAVKQEDSNPDDRQDVHAVKDNSMEALDHTNEDYYVYDTETPQISGIERADTAPGQVYQTDDQVEDEIKPSAEQTVHPEREELFSEMQESDSSSQTLQSEDRLDSQSQLNDTGFSPTRNRRKLGSSRRIKGRHHAKDSVVESHHRLTEEVAGNTRDNEPLETTNISLTIETTVQEKSMETMVEGMDTFVTTQTEEISNPVEENAYVDTLGGISELPTSTVDQQLIDQSNSTEMPEEELPDSVTEKEEEDGDKDADLLRQYGNLQDNYLVSESHFKSEDIESCITPEISKDKHNPSERTEPECSVEQATVSSTKEELPTREEQNEIFSEVKGAQHSEDPENNLHEQEVKPTQIHDIDHSSESVTCDAPENSDIISGNLTDQSEVSDTYQSELIVESADDSAAKQEDSNPDDRQDVHAVKENSMEALDHTNEDYYVYDTETPQISGIERADTAPGQVYQTDDQVEDEIKPSAEQTVHQEKEELFSEMQESDSSSQTLQSEDRLDSQSQLNDTGFSPTRNRRKLGSSRRIKGRHHAKDSVVESHHRLTEEVAGNTRDNEPLETTNISLTIETTVQEKSMETMVEGMDTFVTTQTEEVSGQVEENADVDTLGGISEVTTSTVDQQLIDQSNSTEMPEEELPDSVTEKEEEDGDKDADLLRQYGNLQDNYLVSESHFKSEDIESCITPEISKDKHNPSERTEPECSVEQATVSSTKEELPTSEEQNEIFSEVKGAQHSEDPENNLHEQEVKPTQIHDIDHSSESVTRDATENSDIISGNLTDQSEVSDTYQSELIVESADDSAVKQEDSNPDDRQDVHAVKDNSMEALDHTNEDYYVYDTETPQISGIERADTAPGQVYQTDDQVEDEIKPSAEQTVHREKEELFSEMQESDSSSQTLQSEDRLDSQSQLNDTGFSPTRNRRKLGSSRRIKGRHHAKDSVVESHHRLTEEVAGNTRDNEPLETTNISLTIETTVQEKSMETMVEGMDTFVTTPTEEVSDPVEENAYVDTLGGISELPTSTVDQQLIDQSNSTEMPEEELPDSVTEKEEEDGDKDADLLRQYGNLQDNYLVSESHFKSEDIESCITPEISKDKHNPSERTEPECSVEQATVSSTKEELPTREEQNEIFSEVKGAQHSEDPENNLHEQEVKPTQIHDIDHSSESVTRDATENSDIISGNLTDQSEVSDTYQSELIVESADDSAVKQEDSNPDDRQDVHAVKDNSMEALDHTNEDYYVYDTETPQISGIERADTAPGQVYQTDDQVEDEIKPSAEQTVHQEKEELFSEMQESDSSSQTLQSEDRLDSQSQLNDTGFSPTRNRRKLGSSRRIKGRHHAKDSVVESHHRLTEEVAGNTRDNEPLETTNISLTIETTVQEKSMETMVEGMDTFVTTQTEEISDPVEENAYVDTLGGISELPTSTVDQQLIDQSNSTEMPEEELPDSVTEKEEDGDKDADLLRQDGNLQDNYLVSESHFKSEDIESCITPEISKDKHNPSERTEPECSVEQATVSSTKEELPTSEEQNEIFSEVKGAQHSEDPENNLHEQEVKPTQIHDIDHSSESVTRDATENSDIISGNLTDQSEVSDTYQSELIVESADDSAAKQEDSNPDDRQDVHAVKDNRLEALDHTNEDYYVYDTETPQISVIERADTAQGQVYQTDDQVEDEIKPSAEQTVHREREELFSEMQESDSSSQTLQSEDRLDSQSQLNDTGFSPTRNRRKLGSSRRIKGRHHAKDSVVESHHRLTEEVAGNTRDNEPLETTNISLTIETTVQEKSMETMVEGMDTFVTTQTEEISDPVEENAYVDTLGGISELTTSTVDQQLIDQSNSTEMPEEELPDSVTEKEEDGDKDADLLRQDGNLQDNYLVSESHFKSEDIESCITPEISKDKHNPSERTEPECSVEQATVSSTKEELPTSEEQNEIFSEVKGAQHSEDPENNLHEQEVKPTQIHDIDHSSESVTRDATENSDIISGNLTDQSEVSDTYQSELIVESADDSAVKQEDSNPDDRQDVHAVKDNRLEALDHTNEDYYVYDTETPQISVIERADTAQGQVYQTDDQVEDEIKPSAEQTVHHEREELFSEMQESDSSSQTLQSEDRLDSQSQLNDTGFSPTRNRRKLGSSRRIKGRHHAKDSVVESHHRLTEEVAGNTRDNEPLETTNISLTIETTVQEKSMETMVEGMDTFVTTPTEEVSGQVKENAHVDTLGGISELTTSTVDQQLIDQSNSTEMPEEELPDSVTEKEEDGDKDADLLRQDGNLQDNYLVSESHFKSEDIESCITPEISKDKHNPSERTEPECSVEQATVSSTKEELPTSEEQNEIFSEVKGAQHSEDPENNLHEQEVKPTQIHDIDHSSESVTRDATENSDIISGNLTDQSEVSDTYQSELIVESADDSAVKQEDSNPDDRQDVHAVKDNRLEALDHTNEDYYVYDTETPQISVIERADTAQGQVYQTDDQVEDEIKPSAEQTVHHEREELFSEMQESDSSSQTLQSEDRLDSQSQLNDTGFSPTRNRRKLGSSRRIKGRHHAKDSVVESHHRLTEEVAGNTRDNEPLETTNISLTIETTVQEKSMETMVEGMDTFVTTPTEEVSGQVKENAHVDTLGGISELTTSTVDQQLIDQSNSTEMPEEELHDSVTEKEEEDGDKDADLLRQDGNLQDNYLVSESHFKSEDIESCITPEIITEKSSPGKHNDIECSDEQTTFSSSKEELSTKEEQKDHVNLSEGRGSLHSEGIVNEVHEAAVRQTQMQEMHEIDFSAVKESDSSLQTLPSEINAPLDSQSQDNSARIKEQTYTGVNPIGNRRKLASSRRNKSRQQAKDSEAYYEPKAEVVENTRGDESLETTTKLSLGTETMRQKELKMQTEPDFKPTQAKRKIRSTVNDEDNTEKPPEEDSNSSQNVMDNSKIVTTDITSGSGKDDSVKSNEDINEEEKNPITEPENLCQPTGHYTVKMDSIQSPEDHSDIQNISYHRSVTLDILEQEDTNQVQTMEAVQQTNDPIETVRGVTVRDNNTEVGRSVEVFQQDDHETQEIKASQEITHAELFHAIHGNTDASAPFGHEENLQAEPAEDVPEESGTSTAVGASRIEEKSNLVNSENLQGKSNVKRRKMGSTRRSQLNRKPKEGMDNKDETKESDFMQAEMKHVDKMDAVEELPMTVTAEISQNENATPSLNLVYNQQQETDESSSVHKGLQSIQSNISDIDDLTALLPVQSASHNEEVINPVPFVQVADIRNSERNVDISIEPSQLDDFTGTEMHITSVLAGRNSCSMLQMNNEDVANTGDTGGSFVSFCETIQSTQNDEQRLESINVIQDPALKSAAAPAVAVVDLEIVTSEVRGGGGEEHKDYQAHMPNKVNQGAHNKNLEMKNASPDLNSANRRRKMGSTRRNLGSRSKGEDLHRKQEVDNEATETATSVGDVETESFKAKDSDSEQTKEKVFETVEYSHAVESHFKPPSHQTLEENPASHGHLEEIEHQLSPRDFPAIPSTSPKHDVMSETASGGRRRKLGSHRKSRGHQSKENQTATTEREDGRDVRSIIGESAIKTTGEESLGLDKISEESSKVDESDKKPSSSNISTSKAEEHPRPVSEETHVPPVQHPSAVIHLGQESQKTFSLAGSSRAAASRSNSYNVMMVGDSSVGKTSFMKRAQSGKFSLDLPASVGLDSCMWTVVVDGKPVVLQLWDTAGQERFHSITRQIFHKAQAFLLMYDITSSKSFSAVSYWANCIQEGAAGDVTILLLGNKSDHAERRIKTEEGESLAKEYNFEFMECSAATGENVVQSLETVARMLSQKADTREETTVLHKEPQQKKSSGCC